ncbi:unnamed protein product, partial [Rotaria sp. Silwood2]
MEHIETLLSRTPALVRLKLISRKRAFDSIFDGYNWEQFIINKLLQLNQFEYFFSFIHKTNDYMAVLNRVIASFQTPLWLQEKHCWKSNWRHWCRTSCNCFIEQYELNLRRNQIGMSGAQCFFKLQQNNTTLITLNLQKNRIGDIGAQHFREALKLNKTLSLLSLNMNSIENKGLQHIAACLIINKTITKLKLQQNKITDEGTYCLIDLLQNNNTLTELDLSFNKITNHGADNLACGLQYNT